MPKLLMLKGLPASGKSTYAKDLVAKHGYWRVNKDELRAMAHNSMHSSFKEKFIIHWRDELIKDGLGGGANVVVDDTNFNPVHKAHFQAICEVMKYDFEEKFFDVPVEECIKRDLQRPNSVGAKVIWQMHNQYLKPKPAVYVPPAQGDSAIMVDIDGTLAHMADRSPYDPTLYHTDTVDEAVKDLVNNYYDLGYSVIMCSGRDDTYKDVTVQWLKDNSVKFHEIHMRIGGDKRKDWIVKRELFDAHIRDRFNIHFVLDDRDQVVDMWRNEIGLKVLQVAEGNF
jgi:predicted kinase